MTRVMYDACNPDNLPFNALGAVYLDGVCRTTRTAGRRTISSTTQADADEGDVEPLNPYWPAWVAWVQRQRARGNPYPWLYVCDDGYGGSYFDGWRHADGVAAFRAAGVPEPLWRVFNFNRSTPPSYAVAVQVAVGVGPGYDVSILNDYIPGLDPAPPDPPAPVEVSDVAYVDAVDDGAQYHSVNLEDQGGGAAAIWYLGWDFATSKELGPVNITANGVRLAGGVIVRCGHGQIHVEASPVDQSQTSVLHWYAVLPLPVSGPITFNPAPA